MKKSLAMMLALIMVCALPGIASAIGKGSIESAVITRESLGSNRIIVLDCAV